MINEQKLNVQTVDIFGLNMPIEVYDFFRTAGFVLILCTVVYLFIASPNQVEGNSMYPNLSDKDLIITDKIDRLIKNINNNLGLEYSRGDIVVFQKPGHKDFVKRIVGLPGEHVSISEGQVLINGEKLQENYIEQSYTIGGDFVTDDGDEIIIPEDRYFVLGDNRMDSLDSRYSELGLINKDWIKGKVIIRYWPVSKFSLFDNQIYNI